MKRILSILLVLAMLLSMIPAVFAADCDITVSTPAPDPVKVGALYQLPLGTGVHRPERARSQLRAEGGLRR